jgi:hypothetical protein
VVVGESPVRPKPRQALDGSVLVRIQVLRPSGLRTFRGSSDPLEALGERGRLGGHWRKRRYPPRAGASNGGSSPRETSGAHRSGEQERRVVRRTSPFTASEKSRSNVPNRGLHDYRVASDAGLYDGQRQPQYTVATQGNIFIRMGFGKAVVPDYLLPVHQIYLRGGSACKDEQARRAKGAPNPPPRLGAGARHLPARIAPGCFVPGDFRQGPDSSGARTSTPRIRLSVDGIHPVLPYHCQGKPVEGEPRWES